MSNKQEYGQHRLYLTNNSKGSMKIFIGWGGISKCEERNRGCVVFNAILTCVSERGKETKQI
jgi:hypothetical protein